MALMLGQLYEALRAGNVPDDKARAAAEEVANYEGEIGKLRLEWVSSRNGRGQGRCSPAEVDDGLPDRRRPRRLRLAMANSVEVAVMTDAIKFTLDGREVEAQPGETIWQVAARQGTLIPHLCWLPEPGYRADGNCRACMVEIEGERVLAASCIRGPAPGMKVVTASRACAHRAKNGHGAAARRPARAAGRASPGFPPLGMGGPDGHPRIALSRARACRRPTSAIRRWRSISMPASSAISACAPAARSRSTT